MTSFAHRLAFFAGSAGLFLLGAARVSAQDKPAEPAIELPKVTVTDSQILPPPESWRYGEMPGFEILSNAPDGRTQRMMRDFDLFRIALTGIWRIPAKPSAATPLILCGAGGKFDKFLPKGEQRPDQGTASLFLTDRDRSAIVVDLQAGTLSVATPDVVDATTGEDPSTIAIDHDKQLYREYLRYLVNRSNTKVPAWFEEGLAQIVMRMQVHKDYIVFGEIEPANTVSAAAASAAAENADAASSDDEAGSPTTAPAEDKDFPAALQRRRLVPFAKFFAVGHDAPEARNPLGNNVWAKQAYAFVHMCLYGEGKKYQQGLVTFLMRTAKEPVTEALFKECFHQNYKQMEGTLKAYIDFTPYESQELVIKGKGLPEPAKLVLREATPAEVGRIKGEALELAGRPDDARAELIAPYVRGERDPQLLAELGLYERSVNHDDRARKFLEGAVAGKTTRPRAYLELARLRLAEIDAAVGGPDKELTAEQTAKVVPLLRAGAQLYPPSQDLYRAFGEVWSRSAEKPPIEDITILTKAVVQFPTDPKLVYQAAYFHATAGNPKEMEALIQHALKLTPDPAMRAKFEDLRKLVPAAKK
jgi:hypothetical protein